MKRMAAACVLAVLMAGCDKSPVAPTGSQAPPTGAATVTLSGTVTNGMGVPVEGARVQAVTQYDCPNTPTYPGDNDGLPPCLVDQVLGGDETDVEGRFTIAGLPASYVRVDVHKNDVTVSQGVNLQQDATVTFIMQ
jgi:hypothetical protein